jgi:hypothetical protein
VIGKAWHAETDGRLLSLERIEETARCIDPVFLGSPKYETGVLGDELGQHSVHRVQENTTPACIRKLQFIAACFAAADG